MRYCLFGAAPDTGNLGVSALCYSTLGRLFATEPHAQVTVFDHGRGVRTASMRVGPQSFEFVRCGGFDTRRFYRPESLWNIRTSARLGGLWNAGARAIAAAHAVLDISGGDSFTDLYGSRRFWTVTIPKLIALELGVPLILLPQTYGPFESPRLRCVAESVVRRATMAWARDERSFDVLRALAGPDFHPERHRSGVDVAFALEQTRPRDPLPPELAAWLQESDAPRVAINVSGLIYNDSAAALHRYRFKADYRQVIHGVLRRLVEQTQAKVLLIPHVLNPDDPLESDSAACSAALEALGPASRARAAVLPPPYDQSEAKWVIARAHWFCGTRMHSTIAALSTSVPTAAIAYSLKTAGVFETCGQGDHVIDPRSDGTDAVVQKLWDSWQQRLGVTESLRMVSREVILRAQSQMLDILSAVQGSAAKPRAERSVA